MQCPLSEAELDEVYALPYERTYHPMYKKGVPAIEEVTFSLTSVRGCFGNCNYCAITYHQGRIVQKRSKESLVAEEKQLIADKDFKGYIHDVAAPPPTSATPPAKSSLKRGSARRKTASAGKNAPISRSPTRNTSICCAPCANWKG